MFMRGLLACLAMLTGLATGEAAIRSDAPTFEQASATTTGLGVGLLILAAAFETLRQRARRSVLADAGDDAPARDTDAPGTSHPARVILMRHAEKTGDPDDIHLSDAGRARAEKLATYIPQTIGKVDAIFAAARSKRSIRSIETMEPLGAALGIPVQHDIEDDDVKDLARQLFEDPALAGKTIVICWHHKKLPKLARMLGAPDTLQESEDWSEDVYNVMLDFRYGPQGDPVVTRIEEPF